jgi:predicted SnoaL-like aldol condensation-catalyzing enzyme
MSRPSPRRLAGAALALSLLVLAPAARAANDNLAANKALVENFWKDVFIARNVDAAARYIRPDFIQHDPHMGPGLKGFVDFFKDAFARTPPGLKVEILKTVAEGDLVVTYNQFSGTDPQGKPFTGTGFDMFRLQGGLIAEHWSQVEPD